MQNLWGKYGIPEFIILEICENRELLTLQEQQWIDSIDPFRLINMGPALPSPRFGKHHSPETIIKLSEAGKKGLGRKDSLEARINKSKAMKGKIPTYEVQIARNKALIGKPLTPEHRAKISAGLKNPETLAKIKAATKGRFVSEETRKKRSKSLKGRILTPEHRQKLSLANLGKKATLEARKNMSRAANRKETRDKKSKAMKTMWNLKKLEVRNV